MEASTAIQSRLIGAILVQKNLITSEQLARALELQHETGERLGEIVVAEFGVSRLELASVLAEQWAELENAERHIAPAPSLEAVDPLTPAEVQIRRPIGEIFVELGFIDDTQLGAALDVQRETGARIGEILVEQGSLTRLDLASALAEQWSALQKLRPPSPAPEPQPWQNGAPAAVAAAPAWSEEDQVMVAALEERLTIVERAAAATPSQRDLDAVAAELRAALELVEGRLEAAPTGSPEVDLEPVLEAVETRIAALEAAPLASEVDALRHDLTELAARPVMVDGLAELRTAVEQLQRAPADRAAEVAILASEITVLTARIAEVTPIAELAEKLERLDVVAGQAEVAQTGVAGLSQRVDDLAGLEQRLDEVTARLPGEEVVEELRRALADLSSRAEKDDRSDQGADIASLVARLDQAEARLADIAVQPAPDLTPRLDALVARVDEVAAAVPAVDTEGYDARLESLEARADRAADSAPVETLRSRVDELTTLVAQAPMAAVVDEIGRRLDELAAAVERGPEAAPLDELRGRLDQLAAAVDRAAEVGPDLRTRVDELAAAVERGSDTAPLDELRDRLDQLAAAVDRAAEPAPVEALESRVAELASLVEQAPASTAVEEMRAQLQLLAAAVERGPDSAPLDELRDRVDQLAAAVDRAADHGPVEALRAKIDELAAAVERGSNAAPVDELRLALDQVRVRLDDLTTALGRDELVGPLESRVDALEHRIAAAAPAAELQEELRRVAESTVVERESLAQALFARVEEITAAVPGEDELARLRSRLDELAARPNEDGALQSRVDELALRLESLGVLEGTISGLREEFEGLDALRVGDALATGARLASLEGAVESLADLEDRLGQNVSRELSDRAEELASRVNHLEGRLQAVGAFEVRIAGLASELDGKPDAAALAALAQELREEVAVLAARPTVADPEQRLGELWEKIDRVTRDGHARIGGVADELHELGERLGVLAAELDQRLDELAHRTDGLIGRDEFVAVAAEQAALSRAELDGLRATIAKRDDAAAASASRAEDARRAGHEELEARLEAAIGAVRSDLAGSEESAGMRLEESLGEVRSELARHESALRGQVEESVDSIRGELQDRAGAFDSRLRDSSEETTALRAQVEELQEASRGRAAWEARVEKMLEKRLEALGGRLSNEVAAARAEAQEATAAVRDETGSLTARVDELLALRHSDVQTARAANDDLAARVDALAGLRADDAEAARAAADDLAARLEALAGSLRAETADARAASDDVAAQVAALQGLRADDLAAAELAGAEFAARLDDHAVRTAAAAFEVEQALRDELGGIAARLEERDVQGIEAREELRAELERATSSVGWRLERIEESLAADDTVQLRAAVAELTDRLEGQAALGEEQARATERALRKGLASLGEKLVDRESAYADAGNALRRSIERLGAAVVEADARMADQIPVTEAEGCVAFAPTPAGYRLMEIPGPPPELGSTIEVDGVDGQLVVTRYGRSPLPLDSRPCAYLDRA